MKSLLMFALFQFVRRPAWIGFAISVFIIVHHSNHGSVACSTSSSSTADEQEADSASAYSTVASQFKAPDAQTPLDLVRQWQEADAALFGYIESHVPAVLEHTGASAFDEHLKGVQAVLRAWQAPVHLQSAGLFHSIYGTEGFQGFALPLTERNAIQDVIGKRAEQLCFWFCMVDRYTVDETVFAWTSGSLPSSSSDGGGGDSQNSTNTPYATFRARPELGRFEIKIHTKDEWLDFLELTLADWLEQVEGAAMKPSAIFEWKLGEAYAYRRNAYRRMSEILAVERAPRLAHIAPNMLQQVMATEPPSTRHLVQERTPPMTKAAKDALNALRASETEQGIIPMDFSPQPMLQQAKEDTSAVASSVQECSSTSNV